MMEVFRGVAKRVVAISSIDVYRACGVLHRLEDGPLEAVPLTEASPVRTKLETYPPHQIQALKTIFNWLDDEYDKIPVEREVLDNPHLAGTVLRLPMVYGEGDLLHRLRPLIAHMNSSTEDRSSRRASRSGAARVATSKMSRTRSCVPSRTARRWTHLQRRRTREPV